MTSNNLGEVLDLAPITESSELALAASVGLSSDEAKENIKEIVDTGKEAIQDLLNLARMSEDAKIYNSLSNLIKVVGDLNIKSIELEKEKVKTKTPNTVNNTLFIGSTKDLFDSLDSFKEEEQ